LEPPSPGFQENVISGNLCGKSSGNANSGKYYSGNDRSALQLTSVIPRVRVLGVFAVAVHLDADPSQVRLAATQP